MATFAPTTEQALIRSTFLTDTTNIMVHALAGTGKTTLLTMLAAAAPSEPALALAFNKKIADELRKRFPPHIEIKTFNGLGHSAWGRAIGKKLILDDRKVGRITTELLRGTDLNNNPDSWTNIKKMVTIAQHEGMVPARFPQKGLVQDNPEVWAELANDHFHEITDAQIEVARDVLIRVVQEAFAGTVSFDDQVYMSALYNGVFPRFNLVFCDESQDLSPLNHLQLKSTAAKRMIIVGDEKQAIYSFRGASGDSMERIRALRDSWVDLPLATTFRCPRVIVEAQRYHAANFVAADGNKDGAIHNWSPRGEPPEVWDFKRIKSLSGTGDIAFLCRNNAPLLKLAFRLLADGVGCTMLGRDIGKNLEALSKKILPLDDLPHDECGKLVAEWGQSQISLAQANGHESKVAGIEDRRDCLLAVLESLVNGKAPKNAGELRDRLRYIFTNTENGRVVLSTGHRAKGLEWDTVVHIDPWRLPSKHAKKAMANGYMLPMRQDRNLQYVVETRTKNVLIKADVDAYGQAAQEGVE